MEEAKSTSVSGWQAIGRTVRGASHVRSGLPNQDALLLPEVVPDRSKLILAIADGHGSNRYFRSDVGAQCAVAAAQKVMQSVLHETNLSFVKRLAEEQLPKKLVYAWQNEIKKHYEATPFSPEEQRRLTEKDGNASWERVRANPLLAYGATILAVLITETFILYTQLDGLPLKCWYGEEQVRQSKAL